MLTFSDPPDFSRHLWPNSMLNSLFKPLHEHVYAIQAPSPVLLFELTPLYERALVFSLLPARSASFLPSVCDVAVFWVHAHLEANPTFG